MILDAQGNPTSVQDAAPTRTADGYQNFLAGLGYGAANQSSGGFYNIQYLSRNRQQLDAIYRSSWIIGKAVDNVAEDMTKKGIDISSMLDPDKTEELTVYWRDLRIWEKLRETVKWARLYGGAIGVILIDGQRPETPLRVETVGKNQFKGILPLDRWLVTPSLTELVTDYGPELGLPVYYDTVGSNPGIPAMRVHYTRAIRILGQELPYYQRQTEMFWGQSVAERIFDRLTAFDSTTQGAAQLAFKAHLRIIKIKQLRDIIAAGGPGQAALQKSIDFMRATQSNEGITLLDGEDEFQVQQYAFTGLDSLLLQFGQQLGGAMDQPLVRLFGQSPVGMNATGESDLITYYDGIHVKQEHDLRSGVGRLLNISYRSKYGANPPPGFDFIFRPLWQMSDQQKAEVSASDTNSVIAAYNTGLCDQQTGLKELRQRGQVTGRWSNVTDDLIERAKSELDNPGDLPESMTTAALDPGRIDEELEDEDQNDDLIAPATAKGRDNAGALSRFAGLPITVEYPANSWRVLKNDKRQTVYRRFLRYDYGFIEDTVGRDGDEIDVIVGRDTKSTRVFIVDMKDLGPNVAQRQDEDKVLIGFPNAEAAKAAFLSMYPTSFFGGMREQSVTQFRKDSGLESLRAVA